MSLTYLRQSLRDRLWTLLEAESAVTSIVRPQSRQKLETHAGWLRRFFDNQDPAAFPRIRMTDGRWTSSAFQEAQTFAEENIDFLDDEDASWPVKLGVEYIISLESDVSKTNGEDLITEAVHIALLKGGPRLGFADVVTWSLNIQPDSRLNKQDKQRQAHTSIMRLNATLLTEGRALITT